MTNPNHVMYPARHGSAELNVIVSETNNDNISLSSSSSISSTPSQRPRLPLLNSNNQHTTASCAPAVVIDCSLLETTSPSSFACLASPVQTQVVSFWHELQRSFDIILGGKLTILLPFGPIAIIGDAWDLCPENCSFLFAGIALIPCAERYVQNNQAMYNLLVLFVCLFIRDFVFSIKFIRTKGKQVFVIVFVCFLSSAHLLINIVFRLFFVHLVHNTNRLSFVTEQVAEHTNSAVGALLNATFGNAPELLISIAALRSGYYRVVQLAMLGSMITNLILVFGIACFIGGCRYQVQHIRKTSGNVSILLLLLATAGSLLPATLVLSGHFPSAEEDSPDRNKNTSGQVYHQQHQGSFHVRKNDLPSEEEVTLCRVNAAVMLILYLCYLVFQMGTHKEEFDDNANFKILKQQAKRNLACQYFGKTIVNVFAKLSSKLFFRPSEDVYDSFHDSDLSLPHHWEDDEFCSMDVLGEEKAFLRYLNTNNVKTTRPLAPKSSHENFLSVSDDAEETLKNISCLKKKQERTPNHKITKGFHNVTIPGSSQRFRKIEHIIRQGVGEYCVPKYPPTPMHGETLDMLETTETTVSSDNESDAFSGEGIDQQDITKNIADGHMVVGRCTSNLLMHYQTPSDSATNCLGTGDVCAGSRRKTLSLVNMDVEGIHRDDIDNKENISSMSLWVGIFWLFVITLCISAMSDILVATIEGFAASMNLSQVFTSMVIIPFFSNVAEQVSAFLFAYRNEMDLCAGVTMGSAIQIACFVLPGSVLFGMILDRNMTLYFHTFETVCLFFGVVVVSVIVQGGSTNWLVGLMLVGIYIMFAAGVWFHELEDLSVDQEAD